MRLLDLRLVNIGPFNEIDISLKSEDGGKPHHLILTGENGTGKSIIIDAIRANVLGQRVERELINNANRFLIHTDFDINSSTYFIHSKDNSYRTNNIAFNEHFSRQIGGYPTNFVLDYWNSKLVNESVSDGRFESFKPEPNFLHPLSGLHNNQNISKNIAFFDYLKGSRDPLEQESGNFLFTTAVNIINSCLSNGSFSHVSRQTLKPIFLQHNKEIGIEKLNNGSIYLMQRMFSLLAKAYAAYLLNRQERDAMATQVRMPIPMEAITEIKGLLLIDEAETHLHPKWQKLLFKNVLQIFPNIQIIATTHSPFIVSSLEHAKVYVCKAGADGCYVEDETENYSNKPIEEILRMPLFNTDSFSAEISALLKARKEAFANGDDKLRAAIEASLITKNPEYFQYFNIDKL